METNNLHSIWNKIDSEIKIKTFDELDTSLVVKTRQTINKFLIFLIIDLVVCAGVIIFLTATALNCHGDVIYQINNSLLSLFTLISLIVSIVTWNKLMGNKFNIPLKEWIEQRIRLLSKWLMGKYSKLYIVLLPALLVMINISIHVYYEYKPVLEVLKNEESLYGLIAGTLVGLLVSFYAVHKIRSYQIKNLDYLKELYAMLCNET